MKKAFVTLLSAIAIFASQANAQSVTDLGTWSSLQVIKSFGAPYAMARLEHRSFDNIHGTECWFAMAGGGLNINKWLKGDLSYEYWSIPSAGNMIQHKAVLCLTETLKREGLAVSLREKYELAYNPASGSISNTLRTRFRGGFAHCTTPARKSTSGKAIRWTSSICTTCSTRQVSPPRATCSAPAITSSSNTQP